MARTESVWETGIDGTYIQTIGSPNGYDLLINGTNHYINFNSLVGTSGYGFRDNGGTIQWKNSGGSWQDIGTGGGGGTPASPDTSVQFNNSGSFGGDSNFTYDGSTLFITGKDLGGSGARLATGYFTDLNIASGGAATFQSVGNNNISINQATISFNDLGDGTKISFKGASIVSTNQIITLPDATGTVALLSDITVNGSGTTNQITYWVDSDTLGALTTATYPSLTELSYVKGVTSSIQTQIDSKGSGTVTSVSGTANRITSTGGATPVIDISASYIGQTSITTLGTVTAGTLSTGAVLGGVTMTLGSDANGDIYYRASGILTRLPKGTSLQQLRMNSGATAPEWATITGGGDVTKVGTPVDNQIGVWTGDGTIEGDANFTFSSSQLTITRSSNGASVVFNNPGANNYSIITAASTNQGVSLSANNNINSAAFSAFGDTSDFAGTYIASGAVAGSDIAFRDGFSGTELARFYRTGDVVFNDTGASIDFRIEGDTDANLFFTDGSTDRIGIGTNTPGYKLDVNGAINGTSYRVGGTAGASGTFTTVDLKTVTVVNGIITSIV